MNADEYNQQQNEQEQSDPYVMGVYEHGICIGCGTASKRHKIPVTTYCAHGFMWEFGEEKARPFLNQELNENGITHWDTDRVSVCSNCAKDTENWEI
jgi:hypothetical protein